MELEKMYGDLGISKEVLEYEMCIRDRVPISDQQTWDPTDPKFN